MPKKYRVREGFTFRTDIGNGKPQFHGGGSLVELDDDVAAAHAERLEPVQADAPAPAE